MANQNYRSCIRQEAGKCSIQYEPCYDNSFRIGPMNGMNMAVTDPAAMSEYYSANWEYFDSY